MAVIKTDKLGIENTADKERPHSIPVKNVSRKFDGLLVQWWKEFGLAGDGIVIGDGGHEDSIKQVLTQHFPEINKIAVVDLHHADIIWDICQPAPKDLIDSCDWVICQAVLEHVIDPFCALKHMVSVLKQGGLLYVHTVGPQMKIHRHPVDCLRFLRDFFVLAQDKLPAEIIDLLWTGYHVNVLYRRTL